MRIAYFRLSFTDFIAGLIITKYPYFLYIYHTEEDEKSVLTADVDAHAELFTAAIQGQPASFTILYAFADALFEFTTTRRLTDDTPSPCVAPQILLPFTPSVDSFEQNTNINTHAISLLPPQSRPPFWSISNSKTTPAYVIPI